MGSKSISFSTVFGWGWCGLADNARRGVLSMGIECIGFSCCSVGDWYGLAENAAQGALNMGGPNVRIPIRASGDACGCD